MSLLTTEEKIQCLKNLLADPDDWISAEILRLANEEADGDVCCGIRAGDPAIAKRNK